MYVSVNIYLYFSMPESSVNENWWNTFYWGSQPKLSMPQPRPLYHFIQCWGYSATSVYSAVVSYSAIDFVFWQTVSTLLDNKSMQVITLDLLQRKKRKCVRPEVKVQSLSWIELPSGNERGLWKVKTNKWFGICESPLTEWGPL